MSSEAEEEVVEVEEGMGGRGASPPWSSQSSPEEKHLQKGEPDRDLLKGFSSLVFWRGGRSKKNRRKEIGAKKKRREIKWGKKKKKKKIKTKKPKNIHRKVKKEKKVKKHNGYLNQRTNPSHTLPFGRQTIRRTRGQRDHR